MAVLSRKTMTIQDITCFLNLAETLNYTKTAEELFISQPAVTRHINSLEDELGVKLFDRSVKRKITLTEAGKIYFDGLNKCKQIYNETLDSINQKATETPLIINFLRGIRIPDEIVDATDNYMTTHPTFHHFTNFIEPAVFSQALDNGEIVICQEEYASKLKGYKVIQLTKNEVPHYLVASEKHSGFEGDTPDMQKIKDTTLFLPKNLPNALKEKYLTNLNSLLGTMPIEIMYLDSMDSVELFLRSGRCFTIANEWNSILYSKHHASYRLDFASHYVAILDTAKCVHPLAEDYLHYILAAIS